VLTEGLRTPRHKNPVSFELLHMSVQLVSVMKVDSETEVRTQILFPAYRFRGT